MSLKKKRLVKEITFTFVDNKVHPRPKVEYEDCYLENDQIMAAKKHREGCSIKEAVDRINAAEVYVSLERE